MLYELGVQTTLLSPTKDGRPTPSPGEVEAARDAATAAVSGGPARGCVGGEAGVGGAPPGFLPPRAAGCPPRGEVRAPRTPPEAFRTGEEGPRSQGRRREGDHADGGSGLSQTDGGPLRGRSRTRSRSR